MQPVTDDDLTVARLGTMAALREGDAGLAYRLVLRLMDDGYPLPMIVDEVLAPIQWESGRRWASGDSSISEEHVSTAAVETLVSMLAGAFDQPADAELVVVVCAEGDSHTLPARMASALLSYEGYRAVFLGTSVPADDLAGYLESVAPDALLVSCTRPAKLLGARACVAAGHRSGIPVIVGGRAFNGHPDRWQRIGADAYAPRLSAVTDVMQTWQPDVEQAEQGAEAESASVGILATDRASIVRAVCDAVPGDVQQADPERGRLVAVIEELVDTLAVAVYLDDAAVLSDQAGWLSSLVESQTGRALPVDDLLAALSDAAAQVDPALGDLVDAAQRPTS